MGNLRENKKIKTMILDSLFEPFKPLMTKKFWFQIFPVILIISAILAYFEVFYK